MADMIGNAVTIKGDINKLQALKAAAESETLFQHILPVPADVDTYGWCCDNWGTKWDASEVETTLSEGELHLNFETAWCCPTGIYLALIEQGFTVDWQWEDWESEDEDGEPAWRSAAETVEGWKAYVAAGGTTAIRTMLQRNSKSIA